MKSFSLNSSYFENISLIAGISAAYQSKYFTFIINESFRIEIPEVVAASVSQTVTQMLQTDQTSDELHINLKFRADIDTTIDKIRSVLVSNETVEIDDDEISIFGEFGQIIGNEDFMRPLNERLNKTSDLLNTENVLSILIAKKKCGNHETSNEIKFIANNFESICATESFIIYASDINNIDTIEEILRSNEMRLETEDSLLTFLITICSSNSSNTPLLHLFKYVFVEYCSEQCCSKLIDFVNEVVESPNIRTLISCIGRRFLQPNIKVNPPFIEGRHKTAIVEPFITISNEDPLNGILKREYSKRNVLMSLPYTPSVNHEVDKLFDGDKGTYFDMGNHENSYIEASLKDNKTFVLRSYTMMGHGGVNYCQIQNWKLEGKCASDDKWVLLDEHQKEPFNKFEIRTFDISCNEKLKSVKLTHVGRRPDGNFYLIISAFDIFGDLYES